MYKDGTLTVSYDTWKDGISASPHSGMGDMRNLDPHTYPGALICSRAAVNDTSFIPPNTLTNAIFDEESNQFFIGDDEGNVYRRSSSSDSYTDISGSLSQSDTWGLGIFRNHLFHADNTKLSVYDIDSGNWTNSWQTFALGRVGVIDVPHSMLVGTDDVLYICDGQ